MQPTLNNDPHQVNAENPNRQFEMNEGGSNITVMKGMLIGAAVGGLLALLSSNARTNTKQTLKGAKESVSSVAQDIKSDPSGKATQVIEQVKAASGVIQEVATDVQKVYDTVNTNLETVKEDASKIVATAADTKSEIQSVGEKVVEAKDVALGKETPKNNENKNDQQSKS